MVVLMKECGIATIWRAWATNAFRGPRPVAWDQITLMLTGVQITYQVRKKIRFYYLKGSKVQTTIIAHAHTHAGQLVAIVTIIVAAVQLLLLQQLLLWEESNLRLRTRETPCHQPLR